MISLVLVPTLSKWLAKNNIIEPATSAGGVPGKRCNGSAKVALDVAVATSHHCERTSGSSAVASRAEERRRLLSLKVPYVLMSAARVLGKM